MGFDNAQICLNGHIANSAALGEAQFNKDFCDSCGEKTIRECEKCKAMIRGKYREPGVLTRAMARRAPAFCHKCGHPFPWTTRAIEAAISLATESGDLTQDEQVQFKDSIEQVVKDTPAATVAGSRLFKLLAKMSKGTASAIRDITVDIASETAKKMIWP